MSDKFLNVLALASISDARLLKRIYKRFNGHWASAWAQRVKLAGIGLDSDRLNELSPDHELRKLKDCGVKLISYYDKEYPPLLKQIHDPPFVLYVRGSTDVLSSESLAIVGTRRMTQYGKAAAERIAISVTASGLTIVSGLAFGIDSIALKAAATADVPSVAVLGGGIDDNTLYPPSNLVLAKKILESGGAIVSEYPIGTHATRWTFPRRNRIISGLCRRVLVVEASMESGSMITARLALEQNREVYAVPGPITSSTSNGTNYLIKNGAFLTSSVSDLGIEFANENVELVNSSGLEKEIYDLLSTEALTTDAICTRLNKSLSEVTSVLVELELKGRIKSTLDTYSLT